MSDFRLIHGPEMTILDHSIKEAKIQAHQILSMASSGSNVYGVISQVEHKLNEIQDQLDILRRLG